MKNAHNTAKRAQVKKVFLIMIEIALAIAISLVIFLRITTVKQGTANEEFFIATDLARLIEAVQASPGVTFYSYTHETIPLSTFSFDFPRTADIALIQSRNVR
ncbi:hypothetical protein HY642_00935, partial [Candidatus Woesearchaeota archaeon]|nr:hypothetical protein [Candidatus Woesearchaeota archaeon]